jgi:hypothetical protein
MAEERANKAFAIPRRTGGRDTQPSQDVWKLRQGCLVKPHQLEEAEKHLGETEAKATEKAKFPPGSQSAVPAGFL